jgi:hypothetical protein
VAVPSLVTAGQEVVEVEVAVAGWERASSQRLVTVIEL